MNLDWNAVFQIFTLLITLATCIYTAKSANAASKQSELSRKQLAEMCNQFEESHRPYVTIRFDVIRGGLCCFIITNEGNQSAVDLKITANQSFLDNLAEMDGKVSLLSKVLSTKKFLAPHQSLYVSLTGVPRYDDLAKEIAHFHLTYNGKYSEDIEIDINDYRDTLIYYSELDEIANHLSKLYNEIKSYHSDWKSVKRENKPKDVIVHTIDDSKKFHIFKLICRNQDMTAAEIAEKVELPEDEVVKLMEELQTVDRLVKAYPLDGNKYYYVRN